MEFLNKIKLFALSIIIVSASINTKAQTAVLNAFKKSRQHLFVVVNEYGEVAGLVTIEDVLEEIIGAEIMDEDDKYVDLRARAKERMKKRKINKI